MSTVEWTRRYNRVRNKGGMRAGSGHRHANKTFPSLKKTFVEFSATEFLLFIEVAVARWEWASATACTPGQSFWFRSSPCQQSLLSLLVRRIATRLVCEERNTDLPIVTRQWPSRLATVWSLYGLSTHSICFHNNLL